MPFPTHLMRLFLVTGQRAFQLPAYQKKPNSDQMEMTFPREFSIYINTAQFRSHTEIEEEQDANFSS